VWKGGGDLRKKNVRKEDEISAKVLTRAFFERKKQKRITTSQGQPKRERGGRIRVIDAMDQKRREREIVFGLRGLRAGAEGKGGKLKKSSR